jgi:hypothetical protein
MNPEAARIEEERNQAGQQETVVTYSAGGAQQCVRIPSEEALDLMMGWIAQYGYHSPERLKRSKEYPFLFAIMEKCGSPE